MNSHFIIIHLVLFLGVFFAIILTLKTLKKLEKYLPPYGAKRVHFKFRQRDNFPIEFFSEEYKFLLNGVHYICFFSNSCPLCIKLISKILVIKAPWLIISPTEISGTGSLRTLISTSIFSQMNISMIPYVMHIEEGIIKDYGIVNSFDDLESLL